MPGFGLVRPCCAAALSAAVLVVPLAAGAASEPLDLVPDGSVLAVVTHRAGPAARLAHNHLVVAGGDGPVVTFSPQDPAATRFDVELRVEALRIDEAALQERWRVRLAELAILSESFGQPSERDRGKIRAAMLSAEQLDAASHPTLRARVAEVREQATTLGEVAFSHVADVAWTVRSMTVVRPAAARWEEGDGTVTLEAVAALRFTDFGIEPYSAALGLVRNADEFHVYVRVVGRTR